MMASCWFASLHHNYFLGGGGGGEKDKHYKYLREIQTVRESPRKGSSNKVVVIVVRYVVFFSSGLVWLITSLSTTLLVCGGVRVERFAAAATYLEEFENAMAITLLPTCV